MHSGLGFGLASFGPLLVIAFLWSLIWKGLALWHGARRGDIWWFVAFLILNTLGILEIFYLFFVCKYTLDQLTNTKHHEHHHEHKV